MVTLSLFLLLTLALILLKVSAHRKEGLTWIEWLLVGTWGYMAHGTVVAPVFDFIIALTTKHHP